ncbi:4-phosphopantoate--beta-alanine ligase [Desulfobacterium sp. N47]|uniref:Pantothenate synthetase n=1 Tax=uncultured Desulfobacterium sp. TaxID=201089 RepID=E1YH10_9BACT|nr:Pantothenate synthetase [uncultured Desulfobacterium sp.]
MSAIKIINKIKDMQEFSDRVRANSECLAFVPTMGFLHQGHLALMKKGRELADVVVTSIFVNPTQFGPNEDLASYPRNIERDLELLEKERVDVAFIPDAKDIYPDRFQTYVELKSLPDHLCGLSRPVLFRGVSTIVSKFFNIVKPHIAVFGQKDFQQLLVIKQMVSDLNFDIEIVGVATVREKDGLAMSSRNTYLSPEERINALSLYKSLEKAMEMVGAGVRDSSKIIAQATELINLCPDASIDYIKICDSETLESIDTFDRPAVMALAVKIGTTRLIDNMVLQA